MRRCTVVLFLGWCFATAIIPLDPLGDVRLQENIAEDGLQFKLRVELNTPSNVVFKVYEPNEVHDDIMMHRDGQTQFNLRQDYVYSKKGTYVIRIQNLDHQPALVMVRTLVDKPYESDNDFSELRAALNTLENELASTYNANIQLKGMKEEHIKDAKRLLRRLLLLCVLPLGYVGIGFVKLKRMKMFFQPRK